jgi:hypothetical protein
MKKTGIIEKIQLTHGDLGQQYTTISGKVYHTWFNFEDGIHEGVSVEYEEELGKRISSCPHPGNWDAGIYADVASNIRVLPSAGCNKEN